MQKLAFEFYVPDGICEGCLIEPVFIKRRGLCKKCYGEWYKKTASREDKKNVKIPPRCTKKPPHNVLWYRRRAIAKYGPDIINNLKAIKTKQYRTLTQVGEKYGFSREYARQLFKTLFGKDFGHYEKQKSVARKKDTESLKCNNDPRHKVANYKPGNIKNGAKAELLVFNKCKEMGFDVEVPCDMVFDLKINGFNVDVKSAGKASTFGGKSTYFHFSTNPHQHDQCDFYVCYAMPKDIFYVIPKIAMSPTGCFIRENNIRHRVDYIPARIDYDQYKEAWHLLKGDSPIELYIVNRKPTEQDKKTPQQKRREYYQANKDRIIAQNRKSYYKHRDKRLTHCKERYLRNKAKHP